MIEELVLLIGNWGFPMAVSVYLLVRIEGKLEGLTQSICKLSDAISQNFPGRTGGIK